MLKSAYERSSGESTAIFSATEFFVFSVPAELTESIREPVLRYTSNSFISFRTFSPSFQLTRIAPFSASAVCISVTTGRASCAKTVKTLNTAMLKRTVLFITI